MTDQRTIVVVGTGTVAGTPDQCILHLSLNGIGSTPAESLDICSKAAGGAIDAAVRSGIDRDDIRTVNLSVQDYFDPAQQKVTARIGSYQLQVTVRNLDDVSQVLGVLSETAGDALQIRALQLGLKDTEIVRKEARRKAVSNAQEKADDLAEAAGLQLGGVLTLKDNEGSGPQGYRTMALATAAAGTTMPVEPGQVNVSASVTIRYSILG